MKRLTKTLLESRKDELKRRSFIRKAPVVVGFLLTAGTKLVHAYEPVPGAAARKLDPW